MTPEKAERITADIRAWHEAVVDLESKIDALDEVLDIAPESPLRLAIWSLVGGYIRALDHAWDIGGWLEWWWEELRMGECPSQAGLKGQEMRSIATLDDLIKIALDDLVIADGEA